MVPSGGWLGRSKRILSMYFTVPDHRHFLQGTAAPLHSTESTEFTEPCGRGRLLPFPNQHHIGPGRACQLAGVGETLCPVDCFPFLRVIVGMSWSPTRPRAHRGAQPLGGLRRPRRLRPPSAGHDLTRAAFGRRLAGWCPS